MKVYDTSRLEARRKIEARITVLNAWIAEGIPWRMSDDGKTLRDNNGELLPEFIPASFTEFVAWSSENNSTSVAKTTYKHAENCACILDFGTLSRTTLNQKYNQSLKDTAKELMSTAAACLIKQLEKENKNSIIAAKNAEISYLKLVVQSQERELKVSRINERTAITEKRQEHELRLRNDAEFQRLIKELEAKISSLTQTIAKVMPIKPAMRKKN